MLTRRAEKSDEEALARIRRSAILELTAPVASAEEARQWADRPGPERIAAAIQAHEVWIATEGDEPIGWIEIDDDRVAGLYVSPPFARTGVGSHLLRFAEEAIRRAGHASSRLEASENALGFYLRRGYVHDGARLGDGSYPLKKNL